MKNAAIEKMDSHILGSIETSNSTKKTKLLLYLMYRRKGPQVKQNITMERALTGDVKRPYFKG